MTDTSHAVNVSDVVDRSRVRRFHVTLCLLTGVCLISDGFDVQAMGYAAPALIKDWHVPGAALGAVFSAALVGIFVGSLLFSMLADKVGRRPVLIGGTVFFAIATLGTARAASMTELLALRFVAGLGLGSIMPNVVALIGEYSPLKSRLTMMMLVGNGFNVGGVFGGFVASWLIPSFGWRSVFYVGGAVPLVIATFMVFMLPESLQFMVLHGKDPARIAKWLRRIDPAAAVSGTTRFVVREERQRGVPVVHLFTEGRAVVTVLLWIVFFSNLLNLYLLASWLPTLVSGLGYSTRSAVLVGTTLQVGGVIAAFIMAAVVKRVGLMTVLPTGFAIGCLSIALVGQVGFSLGLLFLVVFFAGWGIVGHQGALNALTGTYYPTYLRSTGLGWCLGIGRVGAIVGPLFAGELMRRQWPNEQLFLAAASLALIATVVILLLRFFITGTAPSATPRQVLVH